MKRKTNTAIKKMSALVLSCLMLTDISGLFASAVDGNTEPPKYMRELSRLISETATDSDFGSIELTVDDPEMTVDGEKTELSEAPSVNPDGEVEIPIEVFEVINEDVVGDSAVTEEELEDQGYDVEVNDQSGSIRITEPYGLCRLIVKTKSGRVWKDHGATHKINVSNNKTILQYETKEQARKAAQLFAENDSVLICAPDMIVRADAVEESRLFKNWGSEAAGADQFMKKLPTDKDLPEVTVAIIDTGVDYNHPFLEGRIKEGGWDFFNDDSDPFDDNEHGTHCAGIVRDATTHNVKILPIKVLSSGGSGDLAIMIEAMSYAVDNGASILSMSLGGDALTNKNVQLCTDAVEYAIKKGVPVVVSAGNDAVNLDNQKIIPAICKDAVTVAAMTSSDKVASYSNYGSVIDIASPGSDVYSSIPGGLFATYSGTSMATPLVAACMALLLTEDNTRTPEQLLEMLREKARDVHTPGDDIYTGCGNVYLGEYRALESVYLELSELTLTEFDSYTLSPCYEPKYPSDCPVSSYTSSNANVVIVSDTGRITAISPGTATVTAHFSVGDESVVKVTVMGNDKLWLKQIGDAVNAKMLLKNNGTAFAYATPKPEMGKTTGYYDGSVDGRPFMFAEGANDPVNDIDRFLNESSFLKTDGTLWIYGGMYISTRTYSSPFQAVKRDGTPLMGVVDMEYDFALCADGTLWQMVHFAEPYFIPVCDQDGNPLTNIKTLGDYYAVTNDGFLYEKDWHTPFLNYYGANSMSLVKNEDGHPLENVKDEITGYSIHPRGKMSYSSRKVLFTDGRLIEYKSGNCTELFSDVKEIVEYGEYIIKNDGTVWEIKTGNQVIKDDGTPLENVVKIVGFGSIGKAALCADGTVWSWGNNCRVIIDSGEERAEFYGFLGIGWRDAKLLDGTPIESMSKDGYTYSIAYNSPPLIQKQPVTAASQVLIDKNTPITNVVDVFISGGSLLYVLPDGTVYCSGYSKHSGYASSILDISVYARPFEIDGRQVCLGKTEEISQYSTERIQKIELSHPDMATTVGETFSLTATAYPMNTYERNVYWRSSDPSVATVDATGKVTAKKEGVATIRAYSTTNDKVWGNCVLTVEKEAPVYVSVYSYPTKREFSVSEKLDTTGGKLWLKYKNGQQRVIAISPDFCSGYDMTKEGSQTVTVSFAGFTFSYGISVTRSPKAPTVTGLTWEKKPAMTVYFLFDDITKPVVSDGYLCVWYSDKSMEKVSVQLSMCSGYDLTQLGEQTVTVSYMGCSVDFTITVFEYENLIDPDYAIYTLLWVDKPKKSTYLVGETLDTAGGAFFDSMGMPNHRFDAEDCSGFDSSKTGEQTVTMTYIGSLPGSPSDPSKLREDEPAVGKLTFDVFVTNLVLKNEVSELAVGQSTRILASFEPVDVDNRRIVWSTSDPDIATVDEYGKVTAVANGTAEITARVHNSEAVASCTITVTDGQKVSGDADGDGSVTLKDAVRIERFLAGGWQVVINMTNADVNADGKVDLKDSVILARYVAGGWNVALV